MKQLLSFILTFCIIFITHKTFTQITASKGWEKMYGSDEYENSFRSIIKDGDFIVAAGSLVVDDYHKIFVAKFKSDGTQIWANTYGVPFRNIESYVIQKGKNGNYFVFVDGFSAMGFLIHEVNALRGAAIQTKPLNNSTTDYVDFKALPLGGFILVGSRTDGKNLFRLDDKLNEIWSKQVKFTVGGIIPGAMNHIDATSNHMYVMARGVKILSSISGDDIIVAKLDLDGNLIWNKVFGSKNTGSEELTEYGSNLPKTSIIAHPDGSAVFTARLRGTSEFQNENKINVLTIKCDKDGNQQWWHVLGQNRTMNPGGLTLKPNGNIVVTGKGNLSGILLQNSSDKKTTAAIYELDKNNGNQLWIKEFGAENDDWVSSAVPLSDKLIIAAGKFDKGFSGGLDKA